MDGLLTIKRLDQIKQESEQASPALYYVSSENFNELLEGAERLLKIVEVASQWLGEGGMYYFRNQALALRALMEETEY